MKKIKGIQITAEECHTVTNGKIDITYCERPIELTIDFTDGTNIVVTKEELEKLLEASKRKTNQRLLKKNT